MPSSSQSVKKQGDTSKKLCSYQDVIDSLRRHVISGRWSAGSMLPSRLALAREHGVSLTTLQQAVSQLIGEGVLTAAGGRGTFVAQGPKQAAAGPSSKSPAVPVPGQIFSSRSPISGSTVGIIDCTSLKIHAIRSDALGWIDAISTRLETVFHSVSGSTRFFTPPQNDLTVPLEEAVSTLMAEKVDALIIIGVFDDPAFLSNIHTAVPWGRIPAVYITWQDVGAAIPHIYFDNFLAGYDAARHLLQNDYSPLAYVGPQSYEWSRQRLTGVQEAAGADSVFVHLLDTEAVDQTDCPDFLRSVLADLRNTRRESSGNGHWGIVTGNDTLALQLMEVARAEGLTPGKDFGLVGFDNSPRSRPLGLTTFRPPLEAMAEHAAQLLINQLQGDGTGVQVRLRCQLLPRATTCRQGP